MLYASWEDARQYWDSLSAAWAGAERRGDVNYLAGGVHEHGHGRDTCVVRGTPVGLLLCEKCIMCDSLTERGGRGPRPI